MQTKARVSISRKNKETGEYQQDFGGYISFFGTAAASKAAKLKEKDRVRLGDVDVRTFYNKEKDVTYYNFNVYSFDDVDSSGTGGCSSKVVPTQQSTVDDGEMDDENLPWA